MKALIVLMMKNRTNKLINKRAFQFFFGILIFLTFTNPNSNNTAKAGIPIITRKLNGGIVSVTTPNIDQTELQTNINNIKIRMGIIFFENKKFTTLNKLLFMTIILFR